MADKREADGFSKVVAALGVPPPAGQPPVPAQADAVAEAPTPVTPPMGSDLAAVAADIAGCTKCVLHETRTHTVPGAGTPTPEILFVGEAPGADEDAQGIPFVGRDPQLSRREHVPMGGDRMTQHDTLDPGSRPVAGRFDGTVAIFFETSKQATTREWDNIEQFNGPHHPLLGFYNYATKDTLLKQLHWIRRAGVDVLVYNMYAFDEWRITDAEKDRVLPWLLEALQDQGDEERKLQLAIYLEGYDGALPTLEEYRFGLDYIREHMSEHSFYFQYARRPLVILYDCKPDAIAQMQSEYPGFTLRRVVPYGDGTDWSYVQEWPQAPNPEWMPASPGIDSFMERCFLEQKKKGAALDPTEVAEMRQAIAAHERAGGEYFRKQVARAREVDPKIIFVSGWNDWQYGTQIEPAEEYEFMYVDLAAELLGRQAETASYRKLPR